jgi:hypothetical protein
MASDNTDPIALSTTVFVLTAGGAVAFFTAVYFFVLR